MMKIKIFWQENCPNCPRARELGKMLENKLSVQYFNVDSVDGLAEASYLDVMTTPSVIIEDEKGQELKSWRGTVPCMTEIERETGIIENTDKEIY